METTRLSDTRFFTECIDTSIPALAPLSTLAKEGQMEEAIRLFAVYVRETLQPEVYLQGERERLAAGEAGIRAEAERVFSHTFISCRTPHTFGGVIDWEHNPTYNNYCEWPG